MDEPYPNKGLDLNVSNTLLILEAISSVLWLAFPISY